MQKVTVLTRGMMVMVSHCSQGGSQVPTMATGEEGWRWHHHNTGETTMLEAVTAGCRGEHCPVYGIQLYTHSVRQLQICPYLYLYNDFEKP